MHWVTPKTKDRMLPDQQGAAGLNPTNPAHRRASEGGAALYYGGRKSKFRKFNLLFTQYYSSIDSLSTISSYNQLNK